MRSSLRYFLLSACLWMLTADQVLGQTVNVFGPSGGTYRWNTNANWSAGQYPNGSGAIAVFGPANALLTVDLLTTAQPA